jgi:hypothetical protein
MNKINKKSKHMKSFWIIIIGSIFFFSACTSYDYGPPFSLRTAESRITGEWILESILIDDIENNIAFENEKDYVLELVEDGTIIKTKKNQEKTVYVNSGIWHLNENKTKLSFEYTDAQTSQNKMSYEILRLTNNEMWIIECAGEIRSSQIRQEKRLKKL